MRNGAGGGRSMTILNLEKLLASVTADAPSGPNLEYDAAFAALERSAAGKPEQVIGGTTTAAEPPDWNAVLESSLELFTRTKDLRVAVLATRALLYRQGVAAFTEGLGLLHGLLAKYWASVHPQLDPEDNNDPTMRVTALSALSTTAITMALRTSPLVSSPALGGVTLGELFPATGAPDAARIAGVFGSIELPALEAMVSALAEAARQLRAIDAVFEAETGSRGPDFTSLLDYFERAHHALQQRLAARRPAVSSDSTAAGGASDELAPAPPPRGLTGDILTREDVVKALDKICEYYSRHEPASPVPIVAQRCKRLVTMSFYEILNEVAPDGVKQAQLVLGKADGK
jgi:type VI secretion system protein ImpA